MDILNPHLFLSADSKYTAKMLLRHRVDYVYATRFMMGSVNWRSNSVRYIDVLVQALGAMMPEVES